MRASFGWLAFALCLGTARFESPARAIPISEVYAKYPSLTRTVAAQIAAGIALADINGDGYDDLIVANGSDVFPQKLLVYYNQIPKGGSEIFSKEPDWVSTECGYMNGLAVGDLNGDGWPDIAVAGAFTTGCDGEGSGGVHVFFNHGGSLEKVSSYQTADHYLPVDVALADVNADGRLDLLVAVYSEVPKWQLSSLQGTRAKPRRRRTGETCNSFLPVPPDLAPARSRIYLNRDGGLSTRPSWKTQEKLNAAGVVAADINQDGWMDVAFAGNRTAVYYGSGRKSPGVPLPEKASWLSRQSFVFSFSVAAGFPGAIPASEGKIEIGGRRSQGLRLVASGWNNVEGTCTSRFYSYLPLSSAAPVWTSGPARLASRALLADLNADGFIDLAANQMYTSNDQPLGFFQGARTGWTALPTYRTAALAIGETLAISDLRRKSTAPHQLTFLALRRCAVLTLPAWIAGPPAVTRKGVPVASVWVPGQNWVSLKEPLEAGDSVTVSFVSSPVLDVAEAAFDEGVAIYLSQYPLPAPQPIRSSSR